MRNNNRTIIKRIIAQNLVVNRKRNSFIVIAIALTTLLLSTLFSIGVSYLSSYKMQQTRLMGTVAHAAVVSPSHEDLKKLSSLDYIKLIGTGNSVATVTNTPQMGDMNLTLHYFDKTEWEQMRSPAFTDIAGYYPKNKNEIMLPDWVIERLGLTPEIGMNIPISYTVEQEGNLTSYTEIFILSGWFRSYMHIRSGNMDSLLVSKSLSDRFGKNPENSGAVSVIFNNSGKIAEYCAILERDLEIVDENTVRPVPMYSPENTGTTITIAIAFIIAFIILTGYLLIYNVLYISVARDVRFYGLLKTIGATPRQIREIVTGQILCLCVVGIPLGLLIAAVLSLFIVPALISTISQISTGVVISFSPIIYISAAFFSLITALLGAKKPSKKAATISPIEAQKYTSVKTKKYCISSSIQGIPYRMALRNILRDRNRSIIVIFSLFLGITTFISLYTLVASMDTDKYISTYISNDIILINNTTNEISDIAAKQKFDDSFLSEIHKIHGFKSMSYDTTKMFNLTYTDSFNEHLNNMHGMQEITSADLLWLENSFNFIAIGVNKNVLSELKDNFDVEAFERGEYLLVATNEPSLYQDIDTVEICSDEDGNPIGTFQIGGYVPLHFHNNSYGMAPTLIMSNSLMERLTGEAIRSKLYIDVKDDDDTQFLDNLKILTGRDYEISRISRLETQEDLQATKIILYILGSGAAFVLAFIGIMNFINIMAVGIMVRKNELATLESIGMSRKQVRKMLICEGACYGVITLFLVSTVGNIIVYSLFKLFRNEVDYAVFTYPAISVLVVSLLIVAVCIMTPEMAYCSINKTSLIERLREAE